VNKTLGAVALLALTACTAAPEQPAPPKFEEIDACSLLKSDDVDGRMRTFALKDGTACHFQFGSDKTAMRVTVRLHAQTFDEARKAFGDRGYGAVIGDRPMVRDCSASEERVECTSIVDAGERKNFEMAVATQEQVGPDVLGQTTQGLAAKVLERLPK